MFLNTFRNKNAVFLPKHFLSEILSIKYNLNFEFSFEIKSIIKFPIKKTRTSKIYAEEYLRTLSEVSKKIDFNSI